MKDAKERARPQEGQTPRGCVGKLAQLVLAKAIDQVLMEPQSVRVRRQTARPVGESAVHTIERLETAGARRFTLDGAEVSRMKAPLAGEGALFEGGEPFDMPRRQEQVRKRQRH